MAKKDAGSPQPNREELLQMGIRAAKDGNNDGARIFFEQVLSQDKRNERATIWMAKIATDKVERKKWLEKTLEINPDNVQARDALKKMAYVRSATENRTLLMFGMVVGVLIVLALVVVVGIILTRP
ncbi:MAG: hypothetical protein GC179_15595 [Anaerolineaceae bacterium]|nr:hypothetical protein [Anaerolineaceae bacterium]